MALAPPPTFAGAVLDRATSERTDDRWVAERRRDPDSRAIAVSADEVLVVEHNGVVAPVRVALHALDADGSAEPLLLGLEGGRALFVVDLDSADREQLTDLAPGAGARGLRDVGALLSPEDGGLVAYAIALLNWHGRHPHCSVCGALTDVEEAGLLRRCPRCGATHHPRVDPVVIMLVTDGERVLLGRQPSWPPRFYSALAGFVEPGESLEEAVAREVHEESGVEVLDPRYVSSQPWPFPGSLMLGFEARYASGEPAVGDGELEDVRWFTRAEIAAATTGDRHRGDAAESDDTSLILPPPLAIARRLIAAWLEQTAPAGG